MSGFALVLPSLAAGGAERVVLHLAAGLVEAGRDVRVIALDATGPLAPTVPAGRLVDLGRPRARRAGPALVRTLRRLGPGTVVVASQTHLNLLLCAVRPALRRDTRLVVREPALLGGPGPGRGLRPVQRLQRRLLPAADLVLASSPAMRAELDGVLRGRARIELLPNPVDVAGLRRAVDGGPRPDGPGRHLVVVGRLVPGKAVDEAITALAAGGGPHDRLTVVGDGPEAPALRALAARLGLAGRVTFTGHLAAPERIVATADALLLPSRHEGLPNVVLEALAVGTPVVATTDLAGLAGLAAAAPAGAVTLVPRDRLAGAIAGLSRRGATGPGPDLLPAEHARDRVVARLLALLP